MFVLLGGVCGLTSGQVQYGPKLTPRYQWLEMCNVRRVEAADETESRLVLNDVEAVSFMFDSQKTRDALNECVQYFLKQQQLKAEQKSGRQS
jgi:hypothetical protein